MHGQIVTHINTHKFYFMLFYIASILMKQKMEVSTIIISLLIFQIILYRLY